jgi:hypothetical protein
VVVVVGGLVVVVTGPEPEDPVGAGLVVVVTGPEPGDPVGAGLVVVVVGDEPPPREPPPFEPVVTGVVGLWWRPSSNSWFKLDSEALIDVFLVAPAFKATMPFGDADASIAIIVTSTLVASTSVAIFGTRCVVLLMIIFWNEPLFMWNKFTDPNHVAAYGDPTFTQL